MIKLSLLQIGLCLTLSLQCMQQVHLKQKPLSINELSRYTSISGIVQHGKKHGRTLGFPTANINLPNNVKSIQNKNGVFAGYALCDSKFYPAVINIGTHPTINELPTKILEAHLLDYEKDNNDLYDKFLTVFIIYKLRDQQKFENITQLQNQIIEDIKSARKILEMFRCTLLKK